jgi:hypothetical protein
VSQQPFRPALPGEVGQEFVDYLDVRCGGDRRLRERLLVFLQQWDHLADDMSGEPSVEAYAERWHVSVPSTYRMLDEFRRVFPTERSPARVLATLWEGLGAPYWRGPDLGSLLEVRIIPNDVAGSPR